jgi:hypothetical protein
VYVCDTLPSGDKGASTIERRQHQHHNLSGGGREQVELGSGLRHEQEDREDRGKKGEKESGWKVAGDECVFIHGEGPGWQRLPCQVFVRQ